MRVLLFCFFFSCTGLAFAQLPADSLQNRPDSLLVDSLPDTAKHIDWDIIRSVTKMEDNVLLNGANRRHSVYLSVPLAHPSQWFLFILLMLMATLLGIARSEYRQQLAGMFKSFINQNIAYQNYRDRALQSNLRNILLYLIFFFSLAGVAYQYLQLNSEMHLSYRHLFLTAIAIMGFVFLRQLMIRGLSAVFGWQAQTGFYLFNISIINQLSGLLILPLLLLQFTAGPAIGKISLGFAVLVLVIGQLMKWLNGWRYAASYLMSHKFHFFLYFCCAEVAPFLIFSKWVSTL